MHRLGAWVLGFALLFGCGTKVDGGGPPGGTTLQVTGVVPATGPVNGGTQVDVQGSGFDDGTGFVGVLFDGYPAEIVSITDTAVTVITPPGGDVGAISVTVENAFGTKTLSDGYTYSEAVYGAAALLWAYDFINPNQFNPVQNDYVDAYAAFFDPTATSLIDDPPTENTCQFNPQGSGNTFVLWDAGANVALDAGGLAVQMPRQDTGSGIVYYPTSVIPGTSVYAPETVYTLAAEGGNDLDAFDPVDALVTPGDFSVTSPDIGAIPAPTVNRSADLGFTWSGGTPGNVFFIQLDGYDANGYTGETLLCRPSDIGGFTVPGNQLAGMTQATQAVVYVGRRLDAYFLLPPNSALGHSAGVIYKVGVLNLN